MIRTNSMFKIILWIVVFITISINTVTIIYAEPSNPKVHISQQVIDSLPATARVITRTPSFSEELFYSSQGCNKVQQWSNGAAFQCPPGIAKKLISSGAAREDRVFKLHDLRSDKQINAADVWTIGYDGGGVIVAILDTGVDYTHVELMDSVIATANFTEVHPNDIDGHGTHVSGIITANGIYRMKGNSATGVSPGAGIMVGKVCRVLECYESDIMAGIDWVVEQDAKVLNLSLGGGNFGIHCDDDPLAAKVNWAVDQGVVVVVSAGNDGAGISSPACASGAIAVGAVNKSDVRADWSNYGEALDLVAPGVDIFSTYSCVAAGYCGYYWYATMSGTSMSAPHVAATAALILQKHPGYTVDDVKQALYNTSVDLGSTGWDHYYGHGRIDALAAVNYQIGCVLASDCDDNNECTIDTCNSGYCSNLEISLCSDGDGCCPSGCNSANDSDCQQCFGFKEGPCTSDTECCTGLTCHHVKKYCKY